MGQIKILDREPTCMPIFDSEGGVRTEKKAKTEFCSMAEAEQPPKSNMITKGQHCAAGSYLVNGEVQLQVEHRWKVWMML